MGRWGEGGIEVGSGEGRGIGVRVVIRVSVK